MFNILFERIYELICAPVNLSIFVPPQKEDVKTTSGKSEIVKKHSDKFCEPIANLVGV